MGTMPNRDAWQEVPDPLGTRFVLPKRALPHLQTVGLVVIAFGLVFDGIVLGVTASVWWPVLRGLTSGAAPGPDAALLAIPVLVVAGMIVPVWLGSLIGFGHAELLVTATHAIGIDRCGPFRYRRRVALADISRLVVDVTPVEVNDKPVRDGPWGDVGALMAERGEPGAKPSALVIGYPRSVLASLGEQVRDRAGLVGGAGGAGGVGEAGGGVPIEITVRDEHADDEAGVPEQPAGSTAVIERTPEGVSISLSPMGFFKGSKGLGCFSILWLGFVSIFGSVSVGIAVNGGSILNALPFLGVSTLFTAIGLGMFFAAVRSGRRRAIIDVVGEDLLITRQSTGAPKTQSWHRSEIDRVVVGKSGTEINDVPVMELQIWPAGGKKVGLFAERDDAELGWIAGEIRAALGLGGRDRTPLPSGADPTPALEHEP
jgi:hypothetical protein